MDTAAQSDKRVVEYVRAVLQELESIEDSNDAQERLYFAHARFQLFLRKEREKLDVPTDQLEQFEVEVQSLKGSTTFHEFWRDVTNVIPGFPATDRTIIEKKIELIQASYVEHRKSSGG